ncbi:MAG TPA: urea amidolyase associated protein UAAP1 [Polyangia bacterium]
MPMSEETGVPASRILWSETVPGAAMRSFVVRRHHTVRFHDVEGGANVGLLLYNHDQTLERYNMPDTLKAQHTAFITEGRALYSDMGRILCSVSEDTAGWHDTVSGHLDGFGTTARWGSATYQERRNDFHRNARDCFLVELGKWGLGKQDLVPNLNLFSKVVADGDGKLSYVVAATRPGSHVDLRAEMNVLFVLNTCPHPFDPSPSYPRKPVRITVFASDPPGPDDLCRTSRRENGWGFENTERYAREVG